jgi:integrase
MHGQKSFLRVRQWQSPRSGPQSQCFRLPFSGWRLALRAHLFLCNGAPAFIAKGRRGPKRAKPITTFGKSWKLACKDAGCPGRIVHDMRRTAVRNLVRSGVPQSVAMEMTGHKTDSVFRRYGIARTSDLRAASRQLHAYLGESRTGS